MPVKVMDNKLVQVGMILLFIPVVYLDLYLCYKTGFSFGQFLSKFLTI